MPSSYTLGTRFESLMRELVQSGRYASQSEVLRDGLRLLEEREAQRKAKLETLREAIREGVESGPGLAAEDVFARLNEKYSGESRN